MKIGFDAKRAFYNKTGLGSYSRTTLKVLSTYYPENQYLLFSPKKDKIPFEGLASDYQTIWSKKSFSFLWRDFNMVKSPEYKSLDIFHGLSGQIPVGKSSVPRIVTIHDLIFLIHPEFYNPIDVQIYKSKSAYAVKNSQIVISISESTKNDVLKFFNINKDKIKVVYQSYNPIFSKTLPEKVKLNVKQKYNLPDSFILYVGTVEPRKNILTVIKAMHFYNIDYPLVIVGRHKKHYFKEIAKFIQGKKIVKNLFFQTNVDFNDLPAIYQQATVFIYPSLYEGFGIPVIEAQQSGVPVITSNISSLPEAAGPHSITVNPLDIDQIANALIVLLNDEEKRKTMIASGYEYVKRFSDKNFADQLMQVYQEVV